MSLQSQRSGTSFHKPTNAPGHGPYSPDEFAQGIILAALSLGIKPTVQLISQGLGTIEAEGTYDPANWGGDGEHIGPWAEESGMGSEADRLDPYKSTVIALKRWKADGKTFADAWWQWEKGETEGTGAERAHKYENIAKGALLKYATMQPSGGGPQGLIEEGADAVSGAVNSAEDFLSEVLSLLTDFRKLGQLAAEAFAWFIKLLARAIWDYVVAPVVHWTERATVWYWENFFTTGTEKGSGGGGIGPVLRQNAGMITIVFWSVGYAVLWSDGTSAAPVPAQRSMLGRGVKAVEGQIARRNLVKPDKVDEKTPDKPKPQPSTVTIDRTGEFSVARKRPVSVSSPGNTQGEGNDNGSDRRSHRVPRPGETPPIEGKEGKQIILPPGVKKDTLKEQKKPEQKKPVKAA